MPVQRTTDAAEAVDDHVHAFFAGHRIESLTQDTGPIRERVPGLRVHAVAPGPRSGWACGPTSRRLLRVLPITEAERDFRSEHGLEALEQRFDDAAIDHTDPHRPSVV